jgi:hypothetical protein
MRWRRAFKFLGIGTIAIIATLLAPIAYVETACTADPQPASNTPLIQDAQFLRPEANTYLTYPEWHIVYAYEGLANTLHNDDEYDFGYISPIWQFWSSYCAINRVAQQHGGASWETRRMIYVIGVSFTVELALKGAYEETIGRVFAVLRGPTKTPQDYVAQAIADDYATFLHQTPWYKYHFDSAIQELWSVPITSPLRSWERRLALTGEWKAKAAYARLIDSAVQATGQAQLDLQSVVSGLTEADLSGIPDVTILKSQSGLIFIKTPRYQAYNTILAEIARRGGNMAEIAGNDDILVTVTVPAGSAFDAPPNAQILHKMTRDGFAETRFLLDVKVTALAQILRDLPKSGIRIEHVFDY